MTLDPMDMNPHDPAWRRLLEQPPELQARRAELEAKQPTEPITWEEWCDQVDELLAEALPQLRHLDRPR